MRGRHRIAQNALLVVSSVSCDRFYPPPNKYLVEARVARSARPTRVGSLRPAIVLYDEPHPLGDDIGTIQGADVARKPDLLIIMGTSLKVHGLRKLVKDFAKAVHSVTPSASSASTTKTRTGKVIFVNRTPPSAEWADIIDYHVCGDTDAWVDKVISDWKKMRPADWEVQQTLVSDGDVSMSGAFKNIKNVSGSKGKGKGWYRAKYFVSPTLYMSSAVTSHTGRENLSSILADSTLLHEGKGLVIDVTHSPGKRGGTASHYNDLESSPSKKRISTLKPQLDGNERKLLFAESTNNRTNPISEDIFDLSMQDTERAVPSSAPHKSPRVKARAVRKARPLVTRSKSASTRTRAMRGVIGKEEGRPSRSR